MLVDLGDAGADKRYLPFDRINLAIIYRCRSDFKVEHQNEWVADPAIYFAAPDNRTLGTIEPQKKTFIKLIVDLFSTATRTSNPFFRAIVANSLEYWISALACH